MSVETVAKSLAYRFGLPLSGRVRETPSGNEYSFVPEDLPGPHGFAVTILLGWRSMRGKLTMGAYARELVQAMSASNREQRRLFTEFVGSAGQSAAVEVLINGSVVDGSSSDGWPAHWDSFSIATSGQPAHLEGDETYREVERSAAHLLAMCLSLAPTETAEVEIPEEEGRQRLVTVKRYERSRLNRELCIRLHGTRCSVCDVDFTEEYGNVGRDYIHVHHTTPVSQVGDAYQLDPATELVPVCPNCHAMLHRRNPPYTVEELKHMRESSRSGQET